MTNNENIKTWIKDTEKDLTPLLCSMHEFIKNDESDKHKEETIQRYKELAAFEETEKKKEIDFSAWLLDENRFFNSSAVDFLHYAISTGEYKATQKRSNYQFLEHLRTAYYLYCQDKIDQVITIYLFYNAFLYIDSLRIEEISEAQFCALSDYIYSIKEGKKDITYISELHNFINSILETLL